MVRSISNAWIGGTLTKSWRLAGPPTASLKMSAFGPKIMAGWDRFIDLSTNLFLSSSLGTEPHINNVELGKHGRYRTNVWSYPGVNSFGNDRTILPFIQRSNRSRWWQI